MRRRSSAAATALVVLLVARRSLGGLREGFTGPKWMLLGGVMSVVIVLAITVAGPTDRHRRDDGAS